MGSLVSVALGVWALLAGMGRVKVSRDPQANARWLAQYGSFMKGAGIILLLVGVFLIVGSLKH